MAGPVAYRTERSGEAEGLQKALRTLAKVLQLWTLFSPSVLCGQRIPSCGLRYSNGHSAFHSRFKFVSKLNLNILYLNQFALQYCR